MPAKPHTSKKRIVKPTRTTKNTVVKKVNSTKKVRKSPISRKKGIKKIAKPKVLGSKVVEKKVEVKKVPKSVVSKEMPKKVAGKNPIPNQVIVKQPTRVEAVVKEETIDKPKSEIIIPFVLGISLVVISYLLIKNFIWIWPPFQDFVGKYFEDTNVTFEEDKIKDNEPEWAKIPIDDATFVDESTVVLPPADEFVVLEEVSENVNIKAIVDDESEKDSSGKGATIVQEFNLVILNGNGVKGMAKKWQKKLAEKTEIKVTRTANADRFNYADTTIRYPIDRLQEALMLRDYINDLGVKISLKEAFDINEVTLVLGKDLR